jgi:hypothetical protein
MSHFVVCLQYATVVAAASVVSHMLDLELFMYLEVFPKMCNAFERLISKCLRETN